jgi:hypothetical protein
MSSSVAAADEPPKKQGCRIIVLNLQGKGLPESEKEIPTLLTETLTGEVAQVSGCQVVSQSDVGQMLEIEATKADCGDGSDSCLAEIGNALGAERVVGGAVGKIGSEFVISARLLDVTKGDVSARAEQAVSGDPARLRRAAKSVGRRLFGAPDLSDDAPVDQSPLLTPPPPPPEPGIPPLAIGGGVVAGLGGATAVVGGGLALLAQLRLNDPNATGKDAITTQGQIAAGVGVGGLLVAITGAVLLGVALISNSAISNSAISN